jgi:hypothetical protein
LEKQVVRIRETPGFTPIAMNKRLRLISGREQLILRPTDGSDTLARATDVFSYIDSNFKNWACDAEEEATEATAVQVYEMVENITLHKMFGGFEVEADQLSLTQAQIKQFVRRYPDWLKKGGNGTFFCSRFAVNFSSRPYIFLGRSSRGARAPLLARSHLLGREASSTGGSAVGAQILIPAHIAE